MIQVSGNVSHTVDFFQGAFTIILAMALGEALRQFVSEEDDHALHWDLLPGLASFLLIFFPFFQSMSQYLYLTYLNAATAPKFYPGFLIFDGFMYVLESACFFVMSRALPPRRWRRFYGAVLALMTLDIVWSGVTYLRGIAVGAWIYIDMVLMAVFALVLLIERGRTASREASLRASFIGLATIAVTTATSYWLERAIYFP
jgi:hypothetical protein